MRDILMSVGVITTIVLFLVGVVKLPFKKFKDKHKCWYRATFFMLSLILAVGLPFISQLLILKETIYSLEFVIHITGVVIGVVVGYNGYEHLGIKDLVKKALQNLKNYMNEYSDTKIAKMVNKVGLEKIVEISNKQKEKEVKE